MSKVKNIKLEATDDEIKAYKKQGKWMMAFAVPFIILIIMGVIL